MSVTDESVRFFFCFDQFCFVSFYDLVKFITSFRFRNKKYKLTKVTLIVCRLLVLTKRLHASLDLKKSFSLNHFSLIAGEL